MSASRASSLWHGPLSGDGEGFGAGIIVPRKRTGVAVVLRRSAKGCQQQPHDQSKNFLFHCFVSFKYSYFSVITALDMAGCSLTVLKADEEKLALWDAAVNTPALKWGN